MGQVELREYVHGPGEWKTVVYTDEKILETFPDNYESLVNKLLRRAQAVEAEIERLRAVANPECHGCGLRLSLENGGRVWCDECVAQLRGLLTTAVDAFESGTRDIRHTADWSQVSGTVCGRLSIDWLTKAKEALDDE